jgi:hypothetical protein
MGRAPIKELISLASLFVTDEPGSYELFPYIDLLRGRRTTPLTRNLTSLWKSSCVRTPRLFVLANYRMLAKSPPVERFILILHYSSYLVR